ncbi:SIR2 family protein [Arthrobacter sp. PM3]|uniref:SIR2 family protein n=1 Tax=Arthrobacter sp. PM3 TaxID=2017685 RepID=UPI001ABEE8F6|nr:SIR2 family protein [Arthrobacter sp. PM3]
MADLGEQMKTLTLLGAGASMDAGVPGSTAMTQKIVEAVDTPHNRHYGLTHAVNYAIGAMIAHRTANGANAYAGIDVEDLFSAVQMLAERESLEIAPFVQWSPALAGVRQGGGAMPAFFDKDFREGILENRAFKGPGEMIKKAVEALTGSNSASTEQLYTRLQTELLNALTKLVSVTDKDVDYLHPLLQTGDRPVEIATLNYDRSIELLCEQRGVQLDTGISSWSGGSDWHWEDDAEVRLLKIHGSIDWRIHKDKGLGGLYETKVVAVDETDSQDYRSMPGVVFGARGKLRADGPFLSMLREFENMLTRADRLLVVGYSFRDAHINVALTRWINSSPLRNLTIIDPAFNNDPRVYDRDSFSAQLLSATSIFEGGQQVSKLNLRVLKSTAAEGLAASDLWSRSPVGAT